jgi:ABC-type metal ion transport system substrate-binding protein
VENRVNSIETDLEILKRDMTSCQAALHKDIEFLKLRDPQLPKWLKNAAGAVVIAIFAQTVSTVWWASELSARQEAIQIQTDKNTAFIDAWPTMHQEVMIGLAEIKAESRHMKEMLHALKEENATIKAKQFTHFKDINNIYNE